METSNPAVHYGVTASGKNVKGRGPGRDAIAAKYNIKCFEMEVAGLLDNLPCVVKPTRGITVCDADSHKNDQWQRHAAIFAAAYAEELLQVVMSTQFRDLVENTSVSGSDY